MTINIQEISTLWEKDESKFQELGKLIYAHIKETITEYEILPEVSFRTKDLVSIIKKIKKKSKERTYSYKDINDKLGIRIICNYKEELDKVDEYLKRNFIINKAEYKKDDLDFDKLDYTSNHYDASINPSIEPFISVSGFESLIFEIQVRTLNQHAWSNTAHSLAYKQEAGIEHYLKRRVYRLLSLYEIADDEFSSVNVALSNNANNHVYSLLRKLESKIYKYAKRDFDRTTSLINIGAILSYLTPEQIQKLIANIDAFLAENSQKLSDLFTENRIRYHEYPFITQPEVFILWFCLENFFFEITDNWANDFDIDDLEQIANLWGRSIN